MFATGMSSYMELQDGYIDEYTAADAEVEAQELTRYCDTCLKAVERAAQAWNAGLILQRSPRCAWDYPDEDTRQLIVDCVLA